MSLQTLSRPTLLILALSLALLAHANPIVDGHNRAHGTPIPGYGVGTKRIMRRIVARAADEAGTPTSSAPVPAATATGTFVQQAVAKVGGIFTPGSRYFVAAVIVSVVVGLLVLAALIALAKYIAHLPRFRSADDYPVDHDSHPAPPSYRSGSSLSSEKSNISTGPSIINRDSKGFFPMSLSLGGSRIGRVPPPPLPPMSEKPAERRKSQGLVGMGSTAHSRHGSEGSDDSYEEEDPEIWDEKTHSRNHSRTSSFGNSPTRAELPRTPAKTWLSNELDTDGRRKLHLALPGQAVTRGHARTGSHASSGGSGSSSGFPQWSREQQSSTQAPTIPLKSPRLSALPVSPALGHSRGHSGGASGSGGRPPMMAGGLDEFGRSSGSQGPSDQRKNRRTKSDDDWRLSVQSTGGASLHVGFEDEQGSGHQRSRSSDDREMNRSRSQGGRD